MATQDFDATVVEKFMQNVKLRAYDDAYIDLKEEKEILQGAVNDGLDVDSARMFLMEACLRYQYALESDIRGILDIILERFCLNDGKIDIDEYNDAIEIGMQLVLRHAPKTTVRKRDIEMICFDIIQQKSYKIQGRLAKHFKRDLGLQL